MYLLYAGAHITRRSNAVEVVERIRSGLSPNNMKKLKSTCFGNLIELPNIKYQAQLMMHLLIRVEEVRDPMVIQFKFDDVTADFRQSDFFILTGLSFDRSKVLPESSYFHESVFNGKETIYMGDIEDAFVKECDMSKGDTLKALKLAMLYFLYGVLFDAGRRNRRIEIDPRYIHAVSDMNLFDSYGWGWEAYRCLLNGVYSGWDEMNLTMQKQTKLVGGITGFSLVLQAWAYESFPNLAAELSEPNLAYMLGDPDLPRLLKREAWKSPQFKQMKEYFHHSTGMTFVRP